ncbi:glycosyltransferase [Pediococcus inopinatus]|uniref:Glycosyltransferase n=1 Tax=Pediococcus inopinatus TaxID=114090 RepID=A0ABZ0Q8D2_9LACO|nr:glycosyltransferase [Pediococcus inopinatus]WPC22380.1 glycosyltransferase [Pediococcus inopinatus]
MIPKIIHYCWFGGKPLTEKILKNIESWKKYCPDYQIIQWNESNFDVKKYKFAFEAYEVGQWAFVSDVARLDIIYNYGGFYLDTDVELLKSLDYFIDNKVFFAREDRFTINTGIGFGAEMKNQFVLENLSMYKNKHFINGDGSFNRILCVDITTHLLSLIGIRPSSKIETSKKIKVYPREYFCPVRIGSGRTVITNRTFSIHHYDASWKDGSGCTSNWLVPIKKVAKFYVDSLFGFGTYNNLKSYVIHKK